MAWGLPIAIYLFLAGAGAGAFLCAMGAEIYSRQTFKPLVHSGTLISGPMVALGMPFLIFDLGMGKVEPWRIFFLFFGNPGSIMSWGAWIISGFVMVALTLAFLELDFHETWPWLEKRKLHHPKLYRRLTRLKDTMTPVHLAIEPYRGRLLVAGTILALATTVYTGLLIGILNSVPLWNSAILPVLFMDSALSTGLAAAVVYAVLQPIEERRLLAHHFFSLNQIHSLMIVIEVLFIFSWLLLSANSSDADNASVHKLMFGNLSLWFWIGIAFFGILDPILIYVYEVLLGKPLMAYGMIVSDGSVLVGGFILRYVALAAAVPVVLF
ncbi:MAG: NrfD/PsrC family molybdoenzyme membrane anchor subunit [Dehalococcoidia bacterium]|nr:NrfD/PsrC family molybdoenzyme membrane anchor subunit [Dehalococcoidia bacterium]